MRGKLRGKGKFASKSGRSNKATGPRKTSGGAREQGSSASEEKSPGRFGKRGTKGINKGKDAKLMPPGRAEKKEQKTRQTAEQIRQEMLLRQKLPSPSLLALQRMVAGGPKSIGPYTNRQRILVIGDGDFSFSLAVASAIGGENMVCTSLDKDTQLKVKYGESVKGTIGTLQGLGAKVLHDVDGTKLSDYAFMQGSRKGYIKTFSRIIFNFPDVGTFEDTKVDPKASRALLKAFLASAAPSLDGELSEVHVALRTQEVKEMGAEQIR